ncbi:MAG: ABC transporter ATP-binding protein [Rhodococcus sp. (in: high G+C Gram-positive bacteria)]|uniref:ABC transporter ATP-binding protein n=1 Tax=Rhodococcus sp. TaxID=1831 RepID=UPI003BB5E0DC
MMRIEKGCFGYRKSKPILTDIDLELGPGHLMAVLGPNGAGKTTLLRCILGLLPWTSGRTMIDDVDIARMRSADLWKTVAYVPQARSAGALSLSGLDMVIIGRAAHLHTLAQPRPEDEAAAEAVMHEIGITHLARVPCGQMSGGQFQMVLIARALAANPRILVLDEPETGLDFRNQLIVLNLLEQLVAQRNLLVIMNTHYPAHALRVADHAMILGRDRTSRFGTVEEMITAGNLRKTFGVEVHLSEVDVDDKTHRSVLPLRLA